MVYTDNAEVWSGLDKNLFPELSHIEVVADSTLGYLSKSGSNRIFQGVLDYLEDSDAQRLFIGRLLEPEYLMAELATRSCTKPISAVIYGTHDSGFSRARAETYGKLLAFERFEHLVVHSISACEDGQADAFLNATRELRQKVHFFADPAFDSPELYHQPSTKLMAPKTTQMLYFGAFHFGKGIDIFARALKKIDLHFQVIVAGDPATRNFEFDFSEISSDSRVEVRSSFQSDRDMYELFRSSDVVVLPYRKTYEHNTSGVLVQAVSARNRVIVPDFEPFRGLLRRYPYLGRSFEAESPESLAQAIKDELSLTLPIPSQIANYLDQLHVWPRIAYLLD